MSEEQNAISRGKGDWNEEEKESMNRVGEGKKKRPQRVSLKAF